MESQAVNRPCADKEIIGNGFNEELTEPVPQQPLVVPDLVEHLALVQGVEGDILGGGPDCKH